MKKVIFHYHFFKNAGTSIDALLKANFPGRWVTREFNGPPHLNSAQVEEWIGQESNAIAFSSHTAMLPPPEIKDVEIFPLIFIRHPIDRIASAYAFERTQTINNFGPVLARHTTLAGYIKVNLALGPQNQCRNFQVARLARMFKGTPEEQIELGLKALDVLPFVGLVEKFDQSIARLSTWLTPHFPDFKPVVSNENVNRGSRVPLEQKLEQIRAEIGSECYAMLLEANAGDMTLYDAVRARYASATTHIAICDEKIVIPVDCNPQALINQENAQENY